jgi:predicted small integral membrane protein
MIEARSSSRRAARGRTEALLEALESAGLVLVALLWMVVVTLLVQEWVSWWAELQSYHWTPDFVRWASNGPVQPVNNP